MKKLLSVLCALQMLNYTVVAQEQSVSINNNHVYDNLNINQAPNTRNINVPVSTGPNGPNGNVFHVALNNNVTGNSFRPNTGGPNVQAYTSSLVPKQTVTRQAVNKPKTAVASGNVKPRPGAVTAAPITTRRPQPGAPTAATPVRRVARPAAPTVTAPIQTPPVQVQESLQVENNIPVIQENNPVAAAQVLNNEVTEQTAAPAFTMIAAPSVRISSASTGSGGGKLHRSKVRKHGNLSYSTHKKMKKLFAHNRKGKFDPAKCFVWN